MPNIFFGNTKYDIIYFDKHETEHLKVLRIKLDDIVECTDGKGNLYKVKIKKIGKKESFGEIVESKYVGNKVNIKLTFFAPAGRWERLRWLLEKSVELGVDKIYIMHTEYSNRKYFEKMEKINLVVRDSCKQCVRYVFPEVRAISFSEVTKFAPKSTFYLDFNGKRFPEQFTGDVGLIVGPEGGFSSQEKEILQSRYIPVSLGDKVLRYETAALLGLGMLAYKLSKI
ncbi:16S rRNA (uracil(1498)-N(3))-methyltransferase [Thermosipho ferrireducens]|uniref:Ribosomal RNA small subunit methyltransferase E n=1 Tax=Thermosipho ferrireducens TaxID=2571116 RepID=A0ABX7S5X4_9BACT|nr:16S rRNA (uracil(1498)-N(3))-methyltransferase [Thermosipho ferrireducens]QTA37130.1 16S rRNA (uracil(1498)-N(3))-methyltransferase [Thermosipho ferrireducens]